MVDELNAFAWEVSRVAREVGSDGKLGGQAQVPGAAGTWKDLTDNVNAMAANLTGQVRNIAEVTTAVAKGDLSKKITVDVKGEILELKSTINTMVDQLNGFASEVSRVAREVGTDGKLGGQAQVPGVAGTWKDLTDNVNSMAANLTNQVRGIAQVVTAVAKGDLKRKVVFEAKGEIAALGDTHRHDRARWRHRASAAISPFASNTTFRFRSPFATAVTTCAMPRTWLVRFAAIELTLSVRSSTCPPLRVPVPGLRACRRCPPRAPPATPPKRTRSADQPSC